MPRTPKPTQEQPAAASAAGALPRPIRVDVNQLEIPDIALFNRIAALDESDTAAVRKAVMDLAPMLDRLVVGGLSGFKLEHMAAVVQEVVRQMGEASDSKN